MAATEAIMADSVTAGAPATTRESSNETFSLNSKNNLERTGRKFIRTADVKCKVKNVRKATDLVEDITIKYNGFIINSNLQTTVDHVEAKPISADSTLETKTYTVANDIMLRVPNRQLDSLMRELNGIVDFLDYRVIKAEDVGLGLLSHELQAKRLKTYEKRATQTIDNQGKKVDESMNAEDDLLDKQNQLDQTVIQSMTLEDQIAYSTVHLQIYQRETIFRELFINPDNSEGYRPNLFVRLGEALTDGWHIFEELLVFFFRLWFLFVIAGVALVLYRRFGRKLQAAPVSREK